MLAEREFGAPRRPARLTLDVRVLAAHALDLRQASADHRFVNWPACKWLAVDLACTWLEHIRGWAPGGACGEPWDGLKVESESAVRDGR